MTIGKQIQWFWSKVRVYRLQAFINTILGLVLVAVDFAFIFASKAVVDTAVGVSSDYSLLTLAVILFLLVFLQIALRTSHRWVGAILGVRAQNTLQQKMFRSVINAVWQGRERRHTGDVLNRLETDVATIVNTATEQLPQMLVVLVRLAGASVFLFILDPWLAVFVIVSMPFFILLSRVYAKRMRMLTREVRETDSRVQSTMQEFVQHQLVVKTLQQVDGAVGRLEDVHSVLRGQIVRRTRFGTFSSVVMDIGFSSVYMVAFLWGAYQLHVHAITYGTLVSFVQLVGQIQMPLRALTTFVPAMIATFTSIERLMDLDVMPQEVAGSSNTYTSPLGIRFVDVTYQYAEGQQMVLNRLSFDFPPQSCCAILGPTGVGKTTMIRLILALVRPLSGSVEVYDADKTMEVSVATRSDMIYVPQGNTLLSGTIRDNLLFGKGSATDEDMHWALTMACAEFVYELKDGLDTVCGELGNGLSEGQAQRIAIARSLLHGGRILLLDEATSALDLDTERRLLANLSMLTQQGKTIIFITHRQEVLKYCTHTLRLEE